MSEKSSSGTENPKQTNKQTLKQRSEKIVENTWSTDRPTGAPTKQNKMPLFFKGNVEESHKSIEMCDTMFL